MYIIVVHLKKSNIVLISLLSRIYFTLLWYFYLWRCKILVRNNGLRLYKNEYFLKAGVNKYHNASHVISLQEIWFRWFWLWSKILIKRHLYHYSYYGKELDEPLGD